MPVFLHVEDDGVGRGKPVRLVAWTGPGAREKLPRMQFVLVVEQV
jgi:hypothetical protein